MQQSNSNRTFLTNPFVVCLLAMVCCGLWGSAFPCIKIGYQMFRIAADDTASQILFAGYRFMLAGVFTIIIGSVFGRKFLLPQRASMGKILKLCMLQTVLQYLFFYIGLAHTTGVKASIIEAVNVFVAIFVASIFFHQEKLTTRKLIGCVIGFCGVILINLTGTGIETSMSLIGEGFIFFSTVAYAFSSVCLKHYSKAENPVVLSGYQFLLGGFIMSICGGIMGGHVREFYGKSIAMLFYLAFISAVAYTLWGILLKYNPISKVAVYGFMNPVFGVILSAVLLPGENEELGMKSIVALILVCAGIYVVNYVSPKQKDEAKSRKGTL
ncbi:MAG: DMT family transporter [Lachnospiraceae bacterium]|nr:DMT family transporter [Lachnospiraceae bacterium]